MDERLRGTLARLWSEVTNGAATEAAFVLNPGDPGLLHSIDRLSAEAASAEAPGGGPSIAAHVDHLVYGLGLLNRWAAGEANPFAEADYSASWHHTVVTDEAWAALRSRLRDEAGRWLDALRQLREVDDVALAGAIGSIVHLAYHLGAIRQVDRSIRGPAAED